MEEITIEVVVRDDMCCGCAACVAVCPKGAVEMGLDAYGYAVPAVDNGSCVMCELCLRACPMHNAVDEAAKR